VRVPACTRVRWISLLAPIALLALLPTSPVHGGTVYDWQQTAAGTYTWANSAYWSPNTGFPNASDDGANFGAVDILGDITVTLDGDRTVNSVVFGDTDTATAAGWTIAAGTPAG